MITIDGELVHDAEHRVSGARSDAVLIMQVSAGRGMPFEIRHYVGPEPGDHAKARELAAVMRAGSPARAVVGAIEPRTDHGAPVLVVRGVAALTVGSVVLA